MKAINGFVSLKSSFVIEKSSEIFSFIERRRKKYKESMIAEWLEGYNELSWYHKLFNIQKPQLTDEQVWQQMRKEAAKDFFGTDPQYWVDKFLQEREEQITEVLDAAKVPGVEEIFVTTEIAAYLNRSYN